MEDTKDHGKILYQESDKMFNSKIQSNSIMIVIMFLFVILGVFSVFSGIFATDEKNTSTFISTFFMVVGILLITMSAIIIARNMMRMNRFTLFEKGIQFNDRKEPFLAYAQIDFIEIFRVNAIDEFIIQTHRGKKYSSGFLMSGKYSFSRDNYFEVMTILKNKLAELHKEEDLTRIIRDHRVVEFQKEVVEQLKTRRFTKDETEFRLRSYALSKGRTVVTMDDYNSNMRRKSK